jgi:hypothetical protein
VTVNWRFWVGTAAHFVGFGLLAGGNASKGDVGGLGGLAVMIGAFVTRSSQDMPRRHPILGIVGLCLAIPVLILIVYGAALTDPTNQPAFDLEEYSVELIFWLLFGWSTAFLMVPFTRRSVGGGILGVSLLLLIVWLSWTPGRLSASSNVLWVTVLVVLIAVGVILCRPGAPSDPSGRTYQSRQDRGD